MNYKIISKPKRTGYIKSSSIILFGFATVFFPRLLDTFGFPSTINFLHFVTISVACVIALFSSKNQKKEQIAILWAILSGLFFLFLSIIASAFVNNAGAINAILSFLLLGEPFFLLLAIVSIPLSYKDFYKFRNRIVFFLYIHLFVVFVQKYILGIDNWSHLPMTGGDRIQGVFFISGAGHTVGASVSFTFGLYYLVSSKMTPLWLRITILIATFWHIVIADAKQVLLSFIVASLILLLTKLNDIKKTLQYLISIIVFGFVFTWCLNNLESFRSFKTWIRPEIYGLDGEATLLKTVTFRIVPAHYNSILNWFFGLGPGHTVSRLGGWMLRSYADLLNPLGATRHIASQEVWQATGASWLGNQSSMFSPLFGWAGIWGDLGIVGLGVYLYLGFLVWKLLCKDDLSKFFLLTVFVFGLIFSQMEEPGYMLSVAAFIGLRWHENRLLNQE